MLLLDEATLGEQKTNYYAEVNKHMQTAWSLLLEDDYMKYGRRVFFPDDLCRI